MVAIVTLRRTSPKGAKQDCFAKLGTEPSSLRIKANSNMDCSTEATTTPFLPSIISKTPIRAPSNNKLLQPHSPQSYTPLQLPFLPAATKAEKYAQMTAFDQSGLKRQKAHVRNALKTTDRLEKVAKQLDLRLSRMEQSGPKISFERLSAYRDAFEEIIKLTNVFSPLLQQIKDVYNNHLLHVLSQHQTHAALSKHLCGPPHSLELIAPPHPHSHPHTSTVEGERGREDLLQLRKKLHQLEVEARVLIHENERLREEVIKEAEIHEKEKAQLDSTDDLVPACVSLSSSSDYASKVEDIQLKIAEERMAIAKVASKRKGRIPLSVCHHLEQCIREVEIEIQKSQRHSNNLSQDIKKTEDRLYSAFQVHGDLLESNDLESILGLL